MSTANITWQDDCCKVQIKEDLRFSVATENTENGVKSYRSEL